MFTTSGCKEIGIRRFEFVAKTQFLSFKFFNWKSGKTQVYNLKEKNTQVFIF